MTKKKELKEIFRDLLKENNIREVEVTSFTLTGCLSLVECDKKDIKKVTNILRKLLNPFDCSRVFVSQRLNYHKIYEKVK